MQEQFKIISLFLVISTLMMVATCLKPPPSSFIASDQDRHEHHGDDDNNHHKHHHDEEHPEKGLCHWVVKTCFEIAKNETNSTSQRAEIDTCFALSENLDECYEDINQNNLLCFQDCIVGCRNQTGNFGQWGQCVSQCDQCVNQTDTPQEVCNDFVFFCQKLADKANNSNPAVLTFEDQVCNALVDALPECYQEVTPQNQWCYTKCGFNCGRIARKGDFLDWVQCVEGCDRCNHTGHGDHDDDDEDHNGTGGDNDHDHDEHHDGDHDDDDDEHHDNDEHHDDHDDDNDDNDSNETDDDDNNGTDDADNNGTNTTANTANRKKLAPGEKFFKNVKRPATSPKNKPNDNTAPAQTHPCDDIVNNCYSVSKNIQNDISREWFLISCDALKTEVNDCKAVVTKANATCLRGCVNQCKPSNFSNGDEWGGCIDTCFQACPQPSS